MSFVNVSHLSEEDGRTLSAVPSLRPADPVCPPGAGAEASAGGGSGVVAEAGAVGERKTNGKRISKPLGRSHGITLIKGLLCSCT